GGLGGKVGDEVLKGLDARAQLVAASAENMRLRAQMGDRLSPEQMLQIWRVVLTSGGDRATIEMALKDAGRVTDPQAKAQARVITAMAARSLGQFGEARAALKGIEFPENSPWRATVDRLNAELSDPRGFFLPEIRRARLAGDYDQA